MKKRHVFSPAGVRPERRMNQRGGKGEAFQRPLIIEAAENSLFSAMSVQNLPPGSSIGFHTHENDEELYIIFSGQGTYRSEEGEHPVGPGDMTICYRGESHGLANTGTEDLIMGGVVVRA